MKIVQPDWTVVNPVQLANPAEKILIRKILSSITSGSQGLLAAKKGRLYRSWKRSQEAEAESTDDASESQSECEMFDSDNVDDLDGSSSSSSSDSSQQEEEQLMKKGMRNRKRRTRRTRRRNSPVQRFANDRIQIQDHPGAP